MLQITAASLKLGTIYNVESDLTSTFYDCSVVFVARLSPNDSMVSVVYLFVCLYFHGTALSLRPPDGFI